MESTLPDHLAVLRDGIYSGLEKAAKSGKVLATVADAFDMRAYMRGLHHQEPRLNHN